MFQITSTLIEDCKGCYPQCLSLNTITIVLANTKPINKGLQWFVPIPQNIVNLIYASAKQKNQNFYYIDFFLSDDFKNKLINLMTEEVKLDFIITDVLFTINAIEAIYPYFMITQRN